MFDKFLEFALLAFQTPKRLRPVFIERREAIHPLVIALLGVLHGDTLERRA